MELTITGDRDELAQSLLNPVRVVAQKGSNDSIKNVRISKNAAGEQYFEATNLDMSVRSHVWGTIEADECNFVITPKVRSALAALPTGAVTIDVKGGLARLSGNGKAKYEVPIGAADGWPTINWEGIDWDSLDTADAKDLIGSMAYAAKFASRSDQRAALRGVNLKQVDGKFVISSTDTFRLYQNRIDAFELVADEDVTLPLGMVTEIGNLFPNGKIKMFVQNNLLFVSSDGGETLFMSRRVGHPFPQVDNLIPKDFKSTMKFKREDLQDTLGRVKIMAKKGTPLVMRIDGDEIAIKVRSDMGAGEEFCACESDCDDFTIGFNFEHFLSGLETFKAGELSVGFVTNLRPAFITSENESMSFLIIPVRVA